MPRCFSTSIQSDVAWRELLRALTVPAIRIAPPNSSSFSVSVVLPASGCEMIANVRRRATSRTRSAGKEVSFIAKATRPKQSRRPEWRAADSGHFAVGIIASAQCAPARPFSPRRRTRGTPWGPRRGRARRLTRPRPRSISSSRRSMISGSPSTVTKVPFELWSTMTNLSRRRSTPRVQPRRLAVGDHDVVLRVAAQRDRRRGSSRTRLLRRHGAARCAPAAASSASRPPSGPPRRPARAARRCRCPATCP